VLPDFRNLGVIGRVLVAVNLAALALALFAGEGWAPAIDRFVRAAAFVEPLLLATLVVLYAAAPWLARLAYWQGCAATLTIALVLSAGLELLMSGHADGIGRVLVLTAAAGAALLAYFRLFAKAYSPALADARLQALQARIRPHFLFNSLNAVLSLIRRDPRRAERALEDLADLFRTLMSDARQFTRLADEIALLERYAAIEQLRLGERLRITWELDAAPPDALLPPLVLQPLLENAVYHGIEPATSSGEILVQIERRGDRVLARIENPFLPQHQHRSGNRIALENIRERLVLFFDAEARIETFLEAGRYRVEIEMPYRTVAPR
jgi:two-component system sensor histidine kinase AlgZ